MPIDLYHTNFSSPCRAVRLAAATIGIDLNLKICNPRKNDQMKPEFLMVKN